jgi:5S rRNA maturation endonuclease (ribonuclease M5)
MVEITIYIEGMPSENPAVLTVDNSAIFRENFHQLFSQKLSTTEFNLRIKPFGSITQAKKMLEQIETQGINAILLMDLDAPKEKIDERLNQYQPFDTSKIFFMIQEMEAWIISQIDKIEEFGKNEGLIRKRNNEAINNNSLIKKTNHQNRFTNQVKNWTLFSDNILMS